MNELKLKIDVEYIDSEGDEVVLSNKEIVYNTNGSVIFEHNGKDFVLDIYNLTLTPLLNYTKHYMNTM